MIYDHNAFFLFSLNYPSVIKMCYSFFMWYLFYFVFWSPSHWYNYNIKSNKRLFFCMCLFCCHCCYSLHFTVKNTCHISEGVIQLIFGHKQARCTSLFSYFESYDFFLLSTVPQYWFPSWTLTSDFWHFTWKSPCLHAFNPCCLCSDMTCGSILFNHLIWHVTPWAPQLYLLTLIPTSTMYPYLGSYFSL